MSFLIKGEVMRFWTYRLLVFTITFFSVNLMATEFRTPMSIEGGPMRYIFEEWEETDYGLKIWTACYGKEAHKSFKSHGTNTHPLSTLFFNESDFTLSSAFPNCYADKLSQYYNPFLGVIKLSPRITYVERGLALGARWAYPVYKNRGRVGLRVHVPFRKIEIEREDSGDKDTDQLKDVYTAEIVDVKRSDAPTTELVEEQAAYSIRLDFLEALYYTSERSSIIDYSASPSGLVKILGNGVQYANKDVVGAVIYSPEGIVPSTAAGNLIGVYQNEPTLANLPGDGNVTDLTKQYKFVTGNDYTGLSVDLAADCAAKTAAQEIASKLWITSAHEKSSSHSNKFTDGAQALFDLMDSKFLAPFKNVNVYSWLEDKGFELETGNRSGLGDIDLDLFYEHQFGDSFVAEAMVGVRFPTGGTNKYCNNPYDPHLGNGEHWEIKGGLLFAWQPCVWMNLKIDGKIAHAFEGTEKRMATFKGASVKNIGPCIDADVSWEYFVGHFDINLFHPKTDAISSVIGYEFYYKTKDRIKYKDCTIESWLGKKYNTTTSEWEANPATLDSSVAEKYTEAIAHKIRLETTFRITRYFEIFCGSSYTFAGQNAPKECDGHGGFVITF